MKILVTGGAGFIGSAFVKLAVANSLDIAIVDKLTYAGDIDRIKDFLNRVSFYKLDILNEKHLQEVFDKERPDIIVHFAAETHVDRSIINPKSFALTNIVGTTNLLELSVKYKTQMFIHISTDEVYGELPLDENLRFKETDCLLPNSPYSASKASSDMHVRAFHETFGLPVIIIRPSNNYGPWQYPEKLIPLAISKLLLRETIPVYGNGKNVRTWLFVDDCAEAILSVIKKGVIGEIYNVGSNEERENIYVVKRIIQIMGEDDSLLEFVTDRPGHDIRYALNITKIYDQTGWKPKVPFEEGLAININWYVQNKEWVLSKKITVEKFIKDFKSRSQKFYQ